jgi:hypothetical protein
MGFLSNSRGSTVPATRQMNSFGHAININTLVAAAENQKQEGRQASTASGKGSVNIAKDDSSVPEAHAHAQGL